MDPTSFLEQIWIARWPLASGVGLTLIISFLSIIAGTILGVGVGMSLTYGARPLRWLVAHIWRPSASLARARLHRFHQGNAGPRSGSRQLLCAGNNWTAAQAVSGRCSSHVGEIVRGALQAIPKGQTEAAKAIGLTFAETFIYVLAPQALRQILPAWVNTAAEMVKASTLL